MNGEIGMGQKLLDDLDKSIYSGLDTLQTGHLKAHFNNIWIKPSRGKQSIWATGRQEIKDQQMGIHCQGDKKNKKYMWKLRMDIATSKWDSLRNCDQ